MSGPFSGASVRRRGAARDLAVALVVGACLSMGSPPTPAGGQAERIAAGGAGAVYGAATGVWVTTAIYVTKARFGVYIYSPQDLLAVRVETLPILVAPVAGAVLGAESPGRLGRSALWGGVGFAGGAGLGYLAGHLLGGTDEARWAGGIIGSAAGLVTGALLGALAGGDDEPVTLPSVRVPVRIPVLEGGA